MSTCFKDDDEMRYLTMRARKMVARLTNRELPDAESLRTNFSEKGTELTPAQAAFLIKQIRIDRGLELGTPIDEKKEKPQPKAEVTSRPLQKESRSYGR